MAADPAKEDAVWVLGRASPAWGDYGSVLLHGFASGIRIDDKLQLERTGPYVQPASRPTSGGLVVTEAMRAALERAEFSGMSFQALDKAKVVRSNWTEWDRSAQLPPVLPATGEPEDYIEAASHDPEVAAALGELWELVPTLGGVIAQQQVSWKPVRFQYGLQPLPRPRVDIFRPENKPGIVIVSERLRNLFQTIEGVSFRYQPVLLGDLPSPPLPPRYYLKEGEPVPDGYYVTHSQVMMITNELVRVAVPVKAR